MPTSATDGLQPGCKTSKQPGAKSPWAAPIGCRQLQGEPGLVLPGHIPQGCLPSTPPGVSSTSVFPSTPGSPSDPSTLPCCTAPHPEVGASSEKQEGESPETLDAIEVEVIRGKVAKQEAGSHSLAPHWPLSHQLDKLVYKSILLLLTGKRTNYRRILFQGSCEMPHPDLFIVASTMASECLH